MLVDPPKLDAVDRDLIEALRQDAKASNTELADLLGVAKRTVASRIARLAKLRVLRVTATFDIQGVGFNILSLLTMRVRGRPVEDVARDVARMPETHSVQSVMGDCELLASIVSRNQSHLIELVEKELGRIKGIQSLCCEQVLATRALRTDLGVLREELDSDTPRKFFDAMDHSDIRTGLDSLDRLLITKLQQNGRMPLTQIARQAKVSEGTVRFRLKRLENDKRLRISTVVDAFAVGYRSNAYVALQVSHDQLNRVADAIAGLDYVSLVAVTLSHADLWVALTTPDPSTLATMIHDRIGMLPGVRSTRVNQIAHVYKHDHRWNMRMALDKDSGPG